MSSMLLRRSGLSALRSSRRWISSSAKLRMAAQNGDSKPNAGVNDQSRPAQDHSLAKAAGMGGLPPTPPPDNSNDNNSSNGDNYTVVGQPSIDDKSTTASSRGRKAARKTKRQPVIPDSFWEKSYLPQAKLSAIEDLGLDDRVPAHVWDELRYWVRAGLAQKETVPGMYRHLDHVIVNIPVAGATYVQDTMARLLAAENEADLIILDPQDLAVLGHDGDLQEPVLRVPENQPVVFFRADEHEEGGEVPDFGQSGLMDMIKESAQRAKVPSMKSAEMRARLHALYLRILQHPNTKSSNANQPRIVYLRDYADMHEGEAYFAVKVLMRVIEELRQKGQRLLIVGGASPPLKGIERDGKSVPLYQCMKLLDVPVLYHQDLETRKQHERLFRDDASLRIGEINAQKMLSALEGKRVLRFADKPHELLELEQITDMVWEAPEVERRASSALGRALAEKKPHVDLADFKAANNLIRLSMVARVTAAASGVEKRKAYLDANGKINMDELNADCSEHEARLLSRIVDPSKVQGSFNDVRAPQSTVETLQTLIKLPLVRPDLFQSGILKRNFISGILLFGPPGTGKTMLAKAVAKESASMMLEIQASDIFDMYVGEGEKNVKALFSLARKLSPCVVFIDEVDSMMSKRRSDAHSKSHREIVNQFMVEWDGLMSDNQGIMMMAATNRPFDLDDAVLRRMPRRILVDLPKQADREAILRTLLQDEQHEVSVAELARATEHFSGSDLKSLCVTAALRAVQQEALTMEKRVLRQAHFDEALKLVQASSSDEMDSVVEIRKWAAKYGDGGSKRKKQTIGFS